MTSQDIESMRKDMEEGILSQIQVNQQVLQGSKTSWDLKVIYLFCYYYKQSHNE
jgi:hypothetical protein